VHLCGLHLLHNVKGLPTLIHPAIRVAGETRLVSVGGVLGMFGLLFSMVAVNEKCFRSIADDRNAAVLYIILD
jgi:hypothetical protein